MAASVPSPRASQASAFPIVIVGSGFSGIAMGVYLKKAGIHSFTILEKANDVGGTWRENTYPGAACDVPSHLYSFSFEPKPDWSRSFSPQQEIQDYLRHCVQKYDLARHIEFGARVTGGAFDEASGTWTVDVEGREALRARALVLGNGALHVSKLPEIPGLEDFAGDFFHSAQWNHDWDPAGKTVAVIGTGASAIQFVPQIAPEVAKLHLFQRTPPWIVPKHDVAIPSWKQRLFRAVPAIHRLYRAYIYASLESRAPAFAGESWLTKFMQWGAKKYLAKAVPDPELRRKVTPNYRIGCKRILLSNDYYPALQRDNVDVVTDGIERITRDGVVTRDGVERKVDAILCGTGFAATEHLTNFALVGRDGRRLDQQLRAKCETYLGITISGFPNLYLLMGPNTGLGHNSMIFMIEAQARYALQAIEALRDGATALDVRASVQSRFDAWLHEKLSGTVWSSGCQSWYLKDGRNPTLWPGFTVAYWWRTHRLALADYDVTVARATRDVALPALTSSTSPASP